jgi:signal transduction histidine kinase
VSPDFNDREFEHVWRRWVAQRNVRGLRIIGLVGAANFGVFWLLDWFTVPSELVWPFGGIRLGVVLYCALVVALARTQWARRHHYRLAMITTWIFFLSLLSMVWLMGGPTNMYYAGLNLPNLGTGLLFLFGGRRSIGVYGATIGFWLVMAVFSTGPDELLVAIGHTFFLLGTVGLVIVGQFFFHSSFYDQVRANRAAELAKQSLEKANEDLKQLDKFKSEVFANITHELKTPLAMVLAPLELMLNGQLGALPEVLRTSVQSMHRSAMKLLKMIGDILTLTKLEESRLRLRVDEHEMVVYLEGLVQQIRPLAERKRLRVTFEADVDRCLAWVDLERLERVFINLLSNAAKFTPEGGRIDVLLKDEGESFLVTVRDTGPGFPSELASRVFDRFFQVDMSATRRHSGTGIGLALTKQLVELHGGETWAESAPGEGARFFVRLFKAKEHLNPAALDRRQRPRPVLDGRRESDRGLGDWSLEQAAGEEYRLLDIQHATDRRIVERDPDEDQRAYSVLVVEDTPEVIKVVHLTLRHEAKILAAEDGHKGLELAQEHKPDLIITDLMMPGLDGLELTRRLRQDERTRHIPVVMLTARGDLEDRVAGLETGVNAYLTKPFSPRELLTTVRNLLEIQETTADLMLSQTMDSLEVIAGGLAHEINNPLNYVKNALALIKTDTEKVRVLVAQARERELSDAELASLERLRGRVDKMFTTAEAGMERIGQTVETMRSYAREGFARTLREHDAYAAVRDVIAVIVPSTGRNVAVECDLTGEGVVTCVPEELHQVLGNLVQNAVEAAPDDGTGHVLVRGSREGDEVVLSFKDNGPGMSAEVRERIFTPFFTTKAPGRGMGIGLTIVWRVVRSLGGSIKVESQPGQGAELIVRLPAARRANGGRRRAEAAGPVVTDRLDVDPAAGASGALRAPRGGTA